MCALTSNKGILWAKDRLAGEEQWRTRMLAKIRNGTLAKCIAILSNATFRRAGYDYTLIRPRVHHGWFTRSLDPLAGLILKCTMTAFVRWSLQEARIEWLQHITNGLHINKRILILCMASTRSWDGFCSSPNIALPVAVWTWTRSARALPRRIRMVSSVLITNFR